jgi:hypothetical protein
MIIYRNFAILVVKVFLRASEISKIVFRRKPPLGHTNYPSIDLMSAGKFIESYLVNQVGSTVGLNIKFMMNKENIIKKIMEVGDVDVYIKGRADGRAYATYMMQDKLIRYDYVIEVKHLITQTITNKESIIQYYKSQIISYNILYDLPVIFYAVLKDGFIFEIFYYNEDEIASFKKSIEDYVLSKSSKLMR